MALELRTEYPLDYKGCDGAPVIAQESFGLYEVFSVRKKRSKVVTRQNARPFKRRTVFYWQKTLRTVWFLLIIMKTIKRRDTCG